MRWYLNNNGVVSGPFDVEQFEAWGHAGQLDGNMRLAPEGSEQWVSIHRTPFARLLPAQKQPGKATKVILGAFGLLVTLFALMLCGSLGGLGRSRPTAAAAAESAPPADTERALEGLPIEAFNYGGTAVEFWMASSGEKVLIQNGTDIEQLIEYAERPRPDAVPTCRTTWSCMRRVRITEGDHAGWIGYVRADAIQARR